MSPKISSQKRGGAEPLRSYIDWKNPSKSAGRSAIAAHSKNLQTMGVLLLFLMGFIGTSALWSSSLRANSKSAARSCTSKIQSLEDFVPKKKSGLKQTTQFSEDEVNSYLALNLKAEYHPCLKDLELTFQKNRMQMVATIDFDQLGSTSKSVLPNIIRLLFSGTHTVTAQGKLLSDQGKGRFQLERASFDNSVIPNYLVNEIIAAVGLRQKPPFNPIQYSELPHEIDSLDLQSGYIIVYQ
jgi:hypothetical protein